LIFSLNKPHGSNWVAGQKGSVDVRKADYTAARFSHNDRVFVPRGPIGPSYAPPTVVKSSSSYNTAATWTIVGNLINNTFGMLNKLGVIGNTQNTTKSAVDQLEPKGAGAGSFPEVTQWSNQLATSFNSGSMALTSTLEAMATEITTLEGKTAELSAKAEVAKAAEESIQNAITTQEKTVADKQDAFDASTTLVSQKKQTVEAKEKDRDTAKNAVSQADAEYGKACDAYTQAHDAVVNKQAEVETATVQFNSLTSALQAAETELQNTSETISGPNGTQIPNPAYTALKAKVENLRQQKADAEAKKDELEKELSTLQGKEKEAETAKETAYNNLGDAKEKVDEAEKALNTAQGELDKAKEELQKAEQEQEKCKSELEAEKAKLDSLKKQQADAQQATQDLQDHLSKIAQLKELQAEYQGKIPDLQKAEAKEYTSLTKDNSKLERKNDELTKKYNFTDLTHQDGETEAWNIYTGNNNQINANNTTRASLASRILNSGAVETPIGQTGYSSILYGGQTFYVKGGEIFIKDQLPDDVKAQLK